MKHIRGVTLYSLIASMLVLAGCAPPGPSTVLDARKGRFDVHKWRFASEGQLSLDGQWEFYPDTLLAPQALAALAAKRSSKSPHVYASVPGTFTDAGFKNIGKATYRLHVQLPRERGQLGLSLGYVYVAYRLYLNGALLIDNGLDTLAKNPEALNAIKPSLKPRKIFFNAASDSLDVVLQVANDGYYRAGIIKAPVLGLTHQIEASDETSLALNLISFGALLIMVVYHLILYYYHPRDTASLYFTLLCGIVALRTLCTDQEFIYNFIPSISFELKTKLFYITQYLILPVYFLNFRFLFPRHTHWGLVVFNMLAGLGFAVPILFLGYEIYTRSVAFYIGILAVDIAIILVILWRIGLKSRDVRVLVTGLLLLSFFVLNDALHNIGYRLTERADLAQFGMLSFFVANSFVIARRIAAALTRAEDINQNLENKVLARTEEISLKNDELRAATEAVKLQSEALAQESQKTTESIEVAGRIHRATLPRPSFLSRVLPEYFVMYEPRDIVGGDFYWAYEYEGRVFLAVADATGEGVPGAFYSMITETLLTNIVGYEHKSRPDEILLRLHTELLEVFKAEFSDRDEGVDIGLLVFDPATDVIQYAGAYINLVYFQHGELGEFKGDRTSVGWQKAGKDLKYAAFNLKLSDTQQLFMCTDGLTDQLGGEKQHKFGHPRLKRLLQATHQLPMEEQRNTLQKEFSAWRGDLRQQDDVLAFGIRFSK